MKRNSLQIEYAAVTTLRENERSARRHSKKKIVQLADSIRRLGFNVPIITDGDGLILAGHARLAAAKLVGMDQVPVIRVTHLSEIDCRALILADNKFALNASWDFEVLAGELQELVNVGFDAILTGFDAAEIDLTIGNAEEAKSARSVNSAIENLVPDLPRTRVTRAGDTWLLGRHKLLCGDARNGANWEQLLAGETADIMFTDPPYNVPIPRNVSGLGKVVHGNFAMACGEMSATEFIAFLIMTLAPAAQSCRDGAIAYICMDWRHVGELIEAGKQVFSELKNMCVWNKTNAGMGTFYRNKHELILAFKVGTAPHTNNFGLGDNGRYRTNVWDYAGVNTMSRTRAEELKMHPTVKPVALVVDALKDCSRRGEIVLDPFAGSGTTMIAAEKCGRSARLIEYDPHYCDTIIARFEKVTGKLATLASTGQTFEELAEARTTFAAGETA